MSDLTEQKVMSRFVGGCVRVRARVSSLGVYREQYQVQTGFVSNQIRSASFFFSSSSPNPQMCHKESSDRERGTCSVHHVFEPLVLVRGGDGVEGGGWTQRA